MAPFNTTKSNFAKITFDDLPDEVKENLIPDKHIMINFALRVREIDRNYELNNNCDLDNGVFNKFAQAEEKKAHE